MSGYFVVERSDCCVGLFFLWKEEVSMNLLSFSNAHIDVEVDYENFPFRFTRMYGTSDRRRKNEDWELLDRLKNKSNLPWLLGGDLNDILEQNKKAGLRRKPHFLKAKEDSIPGREEQRVRRWSKPLQNIIKVNVDWAFRAESGETTIGIVARNHQGMMVDGFARKLHGAHTAATAEVCAFKECILLTLENRWHQVVFEGDASNILAMLTAKELDHSG
ncbi:hypothetical protein V6N13_022140 [Hibiscus sabdariffa]